MAATDQEPRTKLRSGDPEPGSDQSEDLLRRRQSSGSLKAMKRSQSACPERCRRSPEGDSVLTAVADPRVALAVESADLAGRPMAGITAGTRDWFALSSEDSETRAEAVRQALLRDSTYRPAVTATRQFGAA